MVLSEVRKIEIPDEIHRTVIPAVIIIIEIFREIISVRILRQNLQGIISVGKRFAGSHFAFPVDAERSAEGELAVGKQIFLFFLPNISESIFYRIAVNKNADFNICGPILYNYI